MGTKTTKSGLMIAVAALALSLTAASAFAQEASQGAGAIPPCTSPDGSCYKNSAKSNEVGNGGRQAGVFTNCSGQQTNKAGAIPQQGAPCVDQGNASAPAPAATSGTDQKQ